MINFESDYTKGCIPEILEELTKTNTIQTPGYGTDEYCDEAKKLIKNACQLKDADIHFLVGGTQTNTTVIASILKPHQGIICADTSHIYANETGAIEATGHKCLVLPSNNGKLDALQIEEVINNHLNTEDPFHYVQPGMIFISFPTETGLLYSKQELTAIYNIAKKYQLPLFIDGARLGYGLAADNNDLSLVELAHNCDVFYIGGTKIGALFGEAVVISNQNYQKDFKYHIKQHGGLLAKGRLLGIQFKMLFENNRYFEISKHANKMANKIKKALIEKGYSFQYPPESNQLFVIVENRKLAELKKEINFHTNGKIDEQHTAIRLVTCFMTNENDVDYLISLL